MSEHPVNMLNLLIFSAKKKEFAFFDDFDGVLLEVKDFYRD